MDQKRRITGFALLLFLSILCSACRNETVPLSSEADAAGLTVAVTIVPEETFVTAVAGDLANVVTMIPPGYSPENYEPAASEIERFQDSVLYFAIGLPVEETVIFPNAPETLRIVSLADAARAVYPERTFADGERDPHIWLSPKRVIVMVETIAEELSAVDPQNRTTYEANAAAYIAELSAVDQELASVLSAIQNRTFVTYHPAFGYLADDYGLEMFSLEEEGREATPQHLQKMIDLAASKNIKVIFYQEEIDSRQSEAYAEEINGKTIRLAPLSPDYTENLKEMAKTMAEVME